MACDQADFIRDSFFKEVGVPTASFPPSLHVLEAAGMTDGGFI
jgi:hypothetical protein